jgi:hypothetical protein
VTASYRGLTAAHFPFLVSNASPFLDLGSGASGIYENGCTVLPAAQAPNLHRGGIDVLPRLRNRGM